MTEFPAGFFDRADESPDGEFYEFDRFVSHLDDHAIAAVSELYRELRLTGDVLDLCSSWISHFAPPPARLVAMGMNANELAANEAAAEWHVRDLNAEPVLPFVDESFDAVTCCVSVDYLTRPVEVFEEVARVLRPGGPFVVTFSNRCFPTKAIRGWLGADDRGRCTIVAVYFAAVSAFGEATVQLRNAGEAGDPLYALWARRLPEGIRIRPVRAADQAFISTMQYEALFVPPGASPLPHSLLDERERPSVPRRVRDEARRCRPDSGGDRRRTGRSGVGPPGRRVRIRRRPDPRTGRRGGAAGRGSGIGTALLESLIAAVPRCSLSVDTRNPALRLYERLGFRLVRMDGEHTAVMLHDPSAGASVMSAPPGDRAAPAHRSGQAVRRRAHGATRRRRPLRTPTTRRSGPLSPGRRQRRCTRRRSSECTRMGGATHDDAGVGGARRDRAGGAHDVLHRRRTQLGRAADVDRRRAGRVDRCGEPVGADRHHDRASGSPRRGVLRGVRRGGRRANGVVEAQLAGSSIRRGRQRVVAVPAQPTSTCSIM